MDDSYQPLTSPPAFTDRVAPTPYDLALRHAIVIGVLFSQILLAFGIHLSPGSLSDLGWLGLTGVAVVSVSYLFAGWFGVTRTDLLARRIGIGFGIAASIVFIVKMILEYVLLPDIRLDLRMDFAGYAISALLQFIAAFVATLRTGRIRCGLQSAVWSALIASLTWFNMLLLTYYAFYGTAIQDQVLMTEGAYYNFQRSGMTDLRSFIMQDYMGAGFIHLLLGPAAAFILGWVGSALASGILKAFRRKHAE